VLALVAAVACARERVPTELIGRWTTDDPRYADRSLEISAERLAFGVGPATRLTYRVRGIERDEDPTTGTLYRVYYDAPGEPERALQVRLPTPGRLRIENHGELWTRASAQTAGG
jgi:hypothetical protein